MWRCGDVAMWRCATFALTLMLLGCTDDSEIAGQSVRQVDSSNIYTPGETWDAPSTFAHLPEYWAGTQYARAVGNIGAQLNGSRYYRCSAAIIGTSRVVSAHHCVPPDLTAKGYQFTFSASTFVNSKKSSSAVVEESLISLGFRGAALTTARNILRDEALPAPNHFGEWLCHYMGQDGTRDVAYFECDPKIVLDQRGETVVLGVGDVFGHLDVQVRSPGNDTPVFAVTHNSRSTGVPKNLLSPGGRVQNRGVTACAGSYTGCVGVQGTDTMGGSSGGPFFTRSDSLSYGVLNGSRWNPVGGGGNTYEPKCHTGALCWLNKELIARFSNKVFEDQFWNASGDLGTTGIWALSASAGSGFGVRTNQYCASSEAMIGLVGSRVNGPGLYDLGTLGSICSPFNTGYGIYGFLGRVFVQTPGALDTRNISTPIATSNSRVTLNRYMNTVWSNSTAVSQPTLTRQSALRCPPGRAVYAVTANVSAGRVYAITSIGCRGGGVSDLEVDVPTSLLGDDLNTSPVRISCSAGRIAYGHAQWRNDRVEDLQLICRPF